MESGEFEEVVDEALELEDAVDDVRDICGGVVIEFGFVLSFEELSEATDHSKGLLEVVGGDVDVTFELGVGAEEICVGLLEAGFYGEERRFGLDAFSEIAEYECEADGDAKGGDHFADGHDPGDASGGGLHGLSALVDFDPSGGAEGGDFVMDFLIRRAVERISNDGLSLGFAMAAEGLGDLIEIGDFGFDGEREALGGVGIEGGGACSQHGEGAEGFADPVVGLEGLWIV
jgi:hypothetical protein